MTDSTGQKTWKWIWPSVGATPVNQGLDSEMFDRSDYPYTETFVREAIQNSLDACLDESRPVTVRFSFHENELTPAHREFLAHAMAFRDRAEKPEIDEWKQGSIKWLVVEDFNSKGLAGRLDDRTGDFWNYWLNFGVSNKDGTQRGGRGIGRVTFLITSRMQTVIGYTRRYSDGQVATCGMCVLRPQMEGQNYLSTHAYLAHAERNSIFELHQSPVHTELVSTFRLDGYEKPETSSGLALVIPYPHDELSAEGILASSIDHFAPAIMSGALVVEADGHRLDEDSIAVIAGKVADRIRTESIRRDVARYLELIRLGLTSDPIKLSIAEGHPLSLEGLRTSELLKKLQAEITNENPVVLEISMPLEKRHRTETVTMTAVVQRTPADLSPIDRLFREGMSLPETRAKSPGEMDMILLIDDGELATYLNFCEGKAHLDLQESKEIRAKLIATGYTGRSVYTTMRFVRSLPVELRFLLTPNTEEPDANVFDAFFSIPSDNPGKSTGKGGNDDGKPPPPPPPPPKVRVFNIIPLDDGLAVKANPEFDGWPVNVSVRIAYADGSRKPAWSEHDFRLEAMPLEYSNCNVIIEDNKIKATECGPDTEIKITGFDTKRELDTTIRPWKDAQKD